MSPHLAKSSTRGDGRLMAARAAWILFAVLLTGLRIAGQVAALNEVRTIALAPEQLQSLQAIGWSAEFYAWTLFLWQLPQPIAWGGLGLLIFLRRPNERGAMAISAMMIGVGMAISIPVWKAFVSAYPELTWVGVAGAFVGNVCLNSFFFAFPNGRYVPRWTLALAVILSASNILLSSDFALPASIVSIVNRWEWLSPLHTIVSFGSIVLLPLYRYRKVSTPIERLQTKWVVSSIVGGFAIFALAASTIFLVPGSYPGKDISLVTAVVQPLGWVGGFQLIAVAVAISILRYRLFDIDIILRRTVTYAIVSGALAIIYFGANIIAQGVIGALGGQRNEVAIVASTLAVAALFSPVRRRVQDAIDRRFNRQRYDADKVVADFAEYAAHETDLATLQARIVGVVSETIQPRQVTVWVRTQHHPTVDR
jgi:hypothetical protein